ncbi:MAG: hypothetical protein Q9182_003053 [Xanthomendoza sp. 2 TL-2023]
MGLSEGATVFLTGATGFLGAYIIRDLLLRPGVRVIAHVRAGTEAAGLERIRETCQVYGMWSDDWSPRLSCLIGDLQKSNLGLSAEAWDKVEKEANVVVHNGARVHWVLPYETLKPANVLSTLAAISLCSTLSKPKSFCFVSSTSVLDTEHYIELSSSGTPVPESDDLEGSRKGLGTGYVTNTDDFLIRHLKGCIQLSSAPIIPNGLNMVPVDHVARCVVACALHPLSSPNIRVAQVTADPRMTFTDFTNTLSAYGYEVDSVPYEDWKRQLVRYVEGPHHEDTSKEKQEEHALMPLYHFVTGDLPSTTRAPLLSPTNTLTALAADAAPKPYPAVTTETVGLYIAYLVRVGFLPPPIEGKGKKALPKVEVGEGMARGRGRN